MWKKFKTMQKIEDTGIVLMIRLDSENEALQVARAAVAGGIRALEVTMSVPNALKTVSEISKEFKDIDLALGVGTVLDAETGNAALLAGANMLVSPHLCPEMIRVANRYQAVSISGAFTPTEVITAAEEGADIVKLFPSEFFGPSYLKTLKAPLTQVPVMPSGGVTPENAGEWFAAGATCLGVGSYITKAARKDGDYKKVTAAAERFLETVKQLHS